MKEKRWGGSAGERGRGERLLVPILAREYAGSTGRQQLACLLPSMADWQRRKKKEDPLYFLEKCKEVPAARETEKEQGFGDLFGRFSFCKKDIWKAHEISHLPIFYFSKIKQFL